jgi:phosphoglycerol transferase MdoB-like AlkP superfamily enzyme
MENNATMLESLLEKAEDFGKTSFELVKLKALDKTSEIVSSFIPYSVVFVLIASFMIFLNLGLAFWLGEILGETYYGFFVVAAFYVIAGLIFYFFFQKRIKRHICNSIINQMLK